MSEFLDMTDRSVRLSQPIFYLLAGCLVFWMLAYALWPTVVTWYFAIASSVLLVIALAYDAKRSWQRFQERNAKREAAFQRKIQRIIDDNRRS